MNGDAPLDRVFDVLRDPARRRLVVSLAESNPRSVDEFANGAADADRSAIQLHHLHLPKLEAAGYITWDRDAGTVVKGPDWDELTPFLDLLEDTVPNQAQD